MKSYPRKRGRYNASELYGIVNKYLSPQDWISPPEKDIVSMLRMWSGILVHDHIQRLLPPNTNEVKKEHYHNGIVLVAKADNVPTPPSDEVWEFKSSATAMDSSKPSHDYQVRLYCSIFERQKGLVFQPVQSSKGLFLKRIGTIERDDKWFEQELEKLYIFHKKVEILWEAKE